jgi:hypothetical protein
VHVCVADRSTVRRRLEVQFEAKKEQVAQGALLPTLKHVISIVDRSDFSFIFVLPFRLSKLEA